MNGRVRTNGLSGESNGRQSRKAALRKLFYFGLGVKRWLLTGAIGVGISAVGLAFVIKNLFDLSLPEFLPWYFEGVLIAALGVAFVLAAAYGLYRSIGPLLFASTNIDTLTSLTDAIYTRRSRGRGPRIVTIGGGTGLSVLLRGVKAHTDNLTAIVTVGDDGGSSGRLRRELGVLPPGDFRNCLVAMSDDESLVGELFQYRFDQGNGLEGHSFGNLFIVAMTDVVGSFEQALLESSRVLAVHGRIMPATLANLSLSARLKDGTVVNGESNITERGGPIDRLFIEPRDAGAHPAAVEAIEKAELVLIGPGSLYTSILPNLLVPGISEAIQRTKATKLYICNVATQVGESDGYTVVDHLGALQSHTVSSIVNTVVYHDKSIDLDSRFLGQPVMHDGRGLEGVGLVGADLIDTSHPVRHDPEKLAAVVMDVYHGRRVATASDMASVSH